MTRRPAAIEKLPPGPFLGRRIELARLCRAVEQTRHGRGAHYWLVGPAGIGKSRLLVEIAHYAGWRRIPAETIPSEREWVPGPLPNVPRVVIVDSVAPSQVAAFEGRLRRTALPSTLILAATRLVDPPPDTCIPGSSVLTLGGLDSEDSSRLLQAWLGSAFDPTEARRIVQSTAGHPGRMRDAVEQLRSIGPRGHSIGPTPHRPGS